MADSMTTRGRCDAITRGELEAIIRDFVRHSPLNIIRELDNLAIYEDPLVGFAAADDPLFGAFQDASVVGDHHLKPGDWLPGAKTVVSYFLPFSERIRKANRAGGEPAMEWAYGRIEGEELNNALRLHLVQEVRVRRARAIAPALDYRFKVVDRRANWSERHVAYAAGLGTFCLNKSLITAKGSAGRLGSVVISAEITPTSREYQDRLENCTMCGECISRCPTDAITRESKDDARCSDFIDRNRPRLYPRYGCGKCQAGVPCEHSIPGNHREKGA